jgi:hypothetical protein
MKTTNLLHEKLLSIVIIKSCKLAKCKKKGGKNITFNNMKGGHNNNTKARNKNTKESSIITRKNKYLNNTMQQQCEGANS